MALRQWLSLIQLGLECMSPSPFDFCERCGSVAFFLIYVWLRNSYHDRICLSERNKPTHTTNHLESMETIGSSNNRFWFALLFQTFFLNIEHSFSNTNIENFIFMHFTTRTFFNLHLQRDHCLYAFFPNRQPSFLPLAAIVSTISYVGFYSTSDLPRYTTIQSS